jgi:hypothetical protein
VSDTTVSVETIYRAMLLARSGEARLKMAGSMDRTARELALASIRAADASASLAAVRQALFLRVYGHEFDAPTRERILHRIGATGTADREPPGQDRRRVPVDWDALGLAMTWRDAVTSSFLDLRTGEVRQRSVGFEAEEWELSGEECEDGVADGDLVRVEPIESSAEWAWMEEFTASVTDGRLRGDLEAAIHGPRPFRRFKDVLGRRAHERARWVRFHDARVREAVRAWLGDHGIAPTTAPRPPVE